MVQKIYQKTKLLNNHFNKTQYSHNIIHNRFKLITTSLRQGITLYVTEVKIHKMLQD